MFIRSIILFLCVVFFSATSVFANTAEDQQTIRDNLSKISDIEISQDIISDFKSQNPSSTVFDSVSGPVTYGDLSSGDLSVLINDGTDGPITQAALAEIDRYELINGASSDDGFVDTPTTPDPTVPDPTPDSAVTDSNTPTPCEFDIDGGNVNIGTALDNCLKDSALVSASGSIKVEEGMKDQILSWTLSLAQLLGLLAVGAVVYGGLLMTLSGGEEERIKKGKDVVKWAIVGFLGVLLAGVLVRLVVELIFGIATIV
ncbi:pilin [Candidatus Gracilibacteria bacterium]|nr:pilin [Candidatus Gracilibacteria bacterium]